MGSSMSGGCPGVKATGWGRLQRCHVKDSKSGGTGGVERAWV